MDRYEGTGGTEEKRKEEEEEDDEEEDDEEEDLDEDLRPDNVNIDKLD